MVGRDVLFIDSGNTRLKFKLNSQYGSCSNIAELGDFVSNTPIRSLVVSSVSDEIGEFKKLADQQLNVPFYEVLVEDGFCGLNLCYKNASKLGVDRWLAMLAARAQFPDRNVWVVDCGTALTIDLISSEGCHVGGVIAPGIRLAAESLSQNTANLPLATFSSNQSLGTDTVGCINFGVINSNVALIEATVNKFPEYGSFILMTGGDCGTIAPCLSLEYQQRDHLVLDGQVQYWQNKAPQLREV